MMVYITTTFLTIITTGWLNYITNTCLAIITAYWLTIITTTCLTSITSTRLGMNFTMTHELIVQILEVF